MKLFFPFALLTLSILGSMAALTRADDAPPVTGWIMTLDKPGVPGGQTADYQIGLDANVTHGGKQSAFIKAVNPSSKGFRAWTQAIKADVYRGKRVRLTGFVKTQDATAAGLWMRVDGSNHAQFHFDNMQSRSVKGTADWQSHSVVLDVPRSAAAIYFGSLLVGSSEVWMDDLQVEVVDPKTVVATDKQQMEQRDASLNALPSKVVNPDFETAATDSKTIPGWNQDSLAVPDYEQGLDTSEKHSGKASAYIKSNVDKPTGFMPLEQYIKADAYRGKRVRLTAYLKTDNVKNWVGIEMVILDTYNNLLALDNMHYGEVDRALHGTTAWQSCSIVLDVPTESAVLGFGARLTGTGKVWVDDIKIETVDPKKVASTNILRPDKANADFINTLPLQPVSLDFEKQP